MINFNTNIHEALLVSCVSSEPFTTVLLNPLSGSSIWSFRGAQGGTTGVVEPLGRDARYLLVSIVDKPLIYATALNKKSDSFSSRSLLPGVVRCLASHPSGSSVFASIDSKIYSWMSSNGELLSIAEDAFQNVTVLKVSSCGFYLAAGLADGNVNVYLIPELIAERQHQIEPLKAFRVFLNHSLAVSDIYLTCSANPRLLSVSLDHTVVLSSLCVQQSLLKILADYPIVSCCMDPAESKIIFGIKNGKICVIDLFTEHTKNDENFIIVGTSTHKMSYGVALFEYHTNEVLKVCVNFDGTLLASADSAGTYCIWEFLNGQCLKTATMKGKISTLKFVEHWPELNAKEELNRKCTKINDCKSSQLKFQQTFSNSADKSKHSAINFDKLPISTDEKEKILLEKLDVILSSIPDKRSKVSLLHNNKIPLKKTKRLNETDNSIIIENVNDSFSDVREEENDNSVEIIEMDCVDEYSFASEEGEQKIFKKKRIRLLEQEVKRLMMINKELYEFAATIVTDDRENSRS